MSGQMTLRELQWSIEYSLASILATYQSCELRPGLCHWRCRWPCPSQRAQFSGRVTPSHGKIKGQFAAAQVDISIGKGNRFYDAGVSAIAFFDPLEIWSIAVVGGWQKARAWCRPMARRKGHAGADAQALGSEGSIYRPIQVHSGVGRSRYPPQGQCRTTRGPPSPPMQQKWRRRLHASLPGAGARVQQRAPPRSPENPGRVWRLLSSDRPSAMAAYTANRSSAPPATAHPERAGWSVSVLILHRDLCDRSVCG